MTRIVKPDKYGKYSCGCVWSLGGYWLYLCPEHNRPKVKPEQGGQAG